MFGKNSKPSTHHFDTLVSGKAEIVGDLHFSGGLHIDGKVFGNIIAEDDSKAVIRISEKGVVVGEISAPHVIVNGQVSGDIHSCEHIELASRATVNGNIFYNMIEMVMGSQVSGNLMHRYRGKPENRPAMPKSVTHEKPVFNEGVEADSKSVKAVADAKPAVAPKTTGATPVAAGAVKDKKAE
ncbi:bactofilin family protein [Oceanospirillum sp.]|uniref:bactofilin family protein n=1 Tax=Oceanospirillum sp. TaxID=2021254 RepID=UPI003A9154C6